MVNRYTKADYDTFKPVYSRLKRGFWICGKHGRGGLSAQGVTSGPTEYYDSQDDAAEALRKFKRQAKG